MSKQKANKLKPDPVLKDFWSDNYRFADLFNQVLFDGEDVIKPNHLTEHDTEESMIFREKEHLEALSRSRDVIKQHVDGVQLVLIGLENQMRIHYAMPVRSMLYDALSYTRQCKSLEQIHRRENTYKDSDEFLSGIAKADRIHPVVNLVVYYGEKSWDGPSSLSDMMDVPPCFRSFFNEQKINLLEVSHPGELDFRHEDNQDFFMIIGEFYKNEGRLDLEKFKEQFSEKEIYWETMAAIGAATGTSKLIDYAQKNKGGSVNMCRALENMELEAIQRGFQNGIQQGVQQGVQQGMRQGVQLSMIYLIRENFKHDMSTNVIADFLKMDKSIVEEICERIQSEPNVPDEDLASLLAGYDEIRDLGLS